MPQPASARNPFEDDVSVDLFASKDDWCIQAPEDIIQEAKRSVQVRRPDRVDDTDALLKSKPGGDEDPDDKGVPIILPDNRVVSVELNRRLREELLGPVVFKETKGKTKGPKVAKAKTKGKAKEEDRDHDGQQVTRVLTRKDEDGEGQQGAKTRKKAPEAWASIMHRIGVITAKEEFLEPPAPVKKEMAADPSKGKGKGRRRGERNVDRERLGKVRNPWYLPPDQWFSEELGKDPNETVGLGFPYDTMIMGEKEGRKKEEVGVLVGDKDISLLLDTAKTYFHPEVVPPLRIDYSETWSMQVQKFMLGKCVELYVVHDVHGRLRKIFDHNGKIFDGEVPDPKSYPGHGRPIFDGDGKIFDGDIPDPSDFPLTISQDPKQRPRVPNFLAVAMKDR
mmetsp:Transcript_49165/g.117228  ORF Transcript_49165/g.117228 Transcript_49165/m.117228 type:complete len:393 (-) Transcript_49165:17-1195(-)